MTYKVTLINLVNEGIEKDDAISNLAKRFKLTDSVLRKALNSESVRIIKFKSGTTLKKAEKYKRIIERIGFTAKIEEEIASNDTTAPLEPTKEHTVDSAITETSKKAGAISLKWVSLFYFSISVSMFVFSVLLFLEGWALYIDSPWRLVNNIFEGNLHKYQIGGLQNIVNAVMFSGGAIVAAIFSHLFMMLAISKKTIMDMISK